MQILLIASYIIVILFVCCFLVTSNIFCLFSKGLLLPYENSKRMYTIHMEKDELASTSNFVPCNQVANTLLKVKFSYRVFVPDKKKQAC